MLLWWLTRLAEGNSVSHQAESAAHGRRGCSSSSAVRVKLHLLVHLAASPSESPGALGVVKTKQNATEFCLFAWGGRDVSNRSAMQRNSHPSK
jgi:hypothetical protein